MTLTSLLSKNMIKVIDEHPDGRGTCGKLGGKCVCSIRVLSRYHSLSSKTCSPTQKLPGTCAFGILQRHDQSSTLSAALLLSQEKGERSSTPLTQETTRVSGALCQELGAETNVHFFSIIS